MSSFNPTHITLEPSDRPDQLAGAVMQSLSRPIGRRGVWGPVRSLVLGGLSIGILPLIVWPRRLGQFIVAEEQQLWHLAEWLRINTGDPETAALPDLVRKTGAPVTLWLIPWVLAGIALSQILPMFGIPGHPLHGMGLAISHFYRQSQNLNFLRNGIDLSSTTQFRQLVCTACLFMGFVSHWIHVRIHAVRVTRVVERMNQVMVRQNLDPISPSDWAPGMNPLWIVAALIGIAWGAWWAIPAAFAGAAHERYAARTSLIIRGRMAQRVRLLLLRQRPPLDVPTPFRFRTACTNKLCRQPLTQNAAFCPRCGTRLSQKIDAIA